MTGRRPLRAFTLLELVMTLGVFSVMLLALYNFFLSSNKTFLFETAYISTDGSAANVVSAIRSAALPANAVLASQALGGTTYTSSSTVLVLSLPSVDSSGQVVSSKYDYVAFYKTGTTVYQKTVADASSARTSGTKSLTTTASSFTLTYSTTDFTQVKSFTVDIQTTSSVKTQSVQGHLSQTIYLRNAS